MRSTFVPALALSAFLAAAGLALAQEASSSSSAPASAPSTVKVTRGALRLAIDLDANFEPVGGLEVKLKPKAYAGDFAVLSAAAHGQAVKKGDTLLALDLKPYETELAAAENDLREAKVKLTRAAADARLDEEADRLTLAAAQQAYDNAVSGLKWFETLDGPQMLQNNQRLLQRTQDAVNDQQDELDQLKKMYQSEDLTNATADIVMKRALRNFEFLKVGLAMQKEVSKKIIDNDYPLAKQHALDAVPKAKNNLEQTKVAVETGGVLRQTALAAAQAGLDRATKKIDKLKADRDLFAITAPADGIVLQGGLSGGRWQPAGPNAFNPGEKVPAGQTVLTLFTPGKLRLTTNVPEARAFWITPQSKATVTPVALPAARYTAPVTPPTRLNTLPSGQQVFDLTIDLPAVDARLLPGMKAAVKIDCGALDNVLLAPANAVAGGKATVKAKDGTTARRSVTLGATDGRLVEIREGLAEGDELVVEAAP